MMNALPLLQTMVKRDWSNNPVIPVQIKGREDGQWEVWCCGLGEVFATEPLAWTWAMQLARLL